MIVTTILFTRIKKTQEEWRDLSTIVTIIDTLKVGVSLLAFMWLCLSRKEAVNVDMIVCVSGLEKLALSL